MTTRIAINGFGRIGRAFFRQAQLRSDIEIVAINDLGSVESLAYLASHDTVYRDQPFAVTAGEALNGSAGSLIVAPRTSQWGASPVKAATIPVFAQKDPLQLPWGALNVDVVIESTGVFTTYDKANVHIQAGAKRVVISAPAKAGDDTSINGEMVVLNANEEAFANAAITSNASCTTNAASPVIVILNEMLGIEKAILNTVHAYTATQALVDGPSKKDLREGRAAAHNMVPSSTGAAVAVGKVYSPVSGLFDGISIRVPVIAGSIADVTFISKRPTTVEEVNDMLTKAAQSDRWKNVFAVTNEPIVSSDILGNTHASIADLEMTRVVGGNLVKVLAWYDNEAGYTNTLIEHAVRASQTPLA